ncbi:family 20 glycosylhydrolase [Pelagerythrobacter sp.]|uniref:family 20 glycosylhydrolase n=1 Tax=Pelagerythrobacter sp. TaxID=2800702 RepID=UPI0035B2D614
MAIATVPGPTFAQPTMTAEARASQAALDSLADRLGYRYEVVDNGPECPAEVENCFLATITLTVPGDIEGGFADRGLALYFGFVNRLPLVESDIFRHELVNGDLQRLTLKPGASLAPGSTHVIKLWGLGSNFSSAFAMPNAYLMADGLEARTIAATRPVVDPDTGLEELPFVAPMTDEARLATRGGEDRTQWLTAERAFAVQADRIAPAASGIAILPRPAEVTVNAGARLDISRGVTLSIAGAEAAALEPALAALARAGAAQEGETPLSIVVDDGSELPDEGYRLRISGEGVEIVAGSVAGASHALRSLAQQVAFDEGRLAQMTITDAPAYGFRGLHVDLGRNFHGRDQLLKLVEAMAAFKLNRLHLHLAEDEGWRIEIPALPELAAIGSERCHDPAEARCLLPQLGAGPDRGDAVDGYLTTQDYIAIVRAADARGIEVIPSIDMPGHSRAAIVAMEARHDRLVAEGRPEEAARYRLIDPADTTSYRSIQNYDDNTLNVCLPSTYRFVDTVVDALADMHREAGVPLRTFHLGADETAGAWVESPACQSMIAEVGGDARELTPLFIEGVSASLAEKGLQAGGWSDGMGHTDAARMPDNAQTNIWSVLHTGAIREAHDQLNRGWDVVLSIPNLGYFDMPYAPHPEEGGYDWATRGVDTHQVFGFMPDNLPANAALIANIQATPQIIADEPVLQPGHRIAGLQAQLWSETIRTDAEMDYMLFPRLLALAERAWRPAAWAPAYRAGETYGWQDARVDRDALAEEWRDFAGRVAAQWPLLDAIGVAYRVAPPGARIAEGQLKANSVFPGTRIEYRVGDGEWRAYDGPVTVDSAVSLRSRSADGTRTSRTVHVEPAG